MRPRILIVEDHTEQTQMIADYLVAHGYAVSFAQRGSDALALAHKQRPALVLVDIQLPGIGGLTAIRRMRDDGQLPTLPIIALTALALPGDREHCLAAGATAYMTRPVSLSALLATMTPLLRRDAGPEKRSAHTAP